MVFEVAEAAESQGQPSPRKKGPEERNEVGTEHGGRD